MKNQSKVKMNNKRLVIKVFHWCTGVLGVYQNLKLVKYMS